MVDHKFIRSISFVLSEARSAIDWETAETNGITLKRTWALGLLMIMACYRRWTILCHSSEVITYIPLTLYPRRGSRGVQ
jgi:hypothetical protein